MGWRPRVRTQQAGRDPGGRKGQLSGTLPRTTPGLAAGLRPSLEFRGSAGRSTPAPGWSDEAHRTAASFSPHPRLHRPPHPEPHRPGPLGQSGRP